MSGIFIKCCGPRPKVEERPLLSPAQAGEVEALFKLLGNQTRLRMLHALVRSCEICVTDLAVALNMKPQAISNQLQRLVDRGMVAYRRVGNHIYYRIVDPCCASLLDRALCLLEDSKGELVHMEDPVVSEAEAEQVSRADETR